MKNKLLAFIHSDSDLENLTEDVEPFIGNIQTEIHQNQKKIIILTKNLGFEKNKVIRRSDKTWTYFASDLFYMANKVQRGFFKQICFLGQDHIGHLNMLKKVFATIYDEVNFQVNSVNYVRVIDEKGNLIKMSKRLGTFLSLQDIIDKNGVNFIKVHLLCRNNNSLIEFCINDLNSINTKKNYGFYLQHSYNRICSILNRVPKNIYDILNNIEFKTDYNSFISHELEMMMRYLLFFEENIIYAYKNIDTHKIFVYIIELINLFNKCWQNNTNNDANMCFITNNIEQTAININIIYAVKVILEICAKKIFNLNLQFT